jgi:NADPH:quinone reductase
MSKLIRFHATGGPEVLQYDEVPDAPLRSGEARLKVAAIGLNRAEIMFREGRYVAEPVFPSLIGYEAAGVITEVADDVVGLKVGDKVSSIPSFPMSDYGAYGESVVLPAFALAKYPDNLSPVEAASIWMQYLTAYMLIEYAQMKAGDTVLITAAASSVGLAAIQIANAVGARSIATTRQRKKVQALLDAGASAVIDTKESDLVEEVHRLTAGAGVNIAFDPIVGPQFQQICDACAESANIFTYGALSPEPAPFSIFSTLSKNLTIRAYQLMLITANPEKLAHAKSWVYDNLQNGKLRPIIARTFPFEKMADAHRYMESNEQVGKIVVTVP